MKQFILFCVAMVAAFFLGTLLSYNVDRKITGQSYPEYMGGFLSRTKELFVGKEQVKRDQLRCEDSNVLQQFSRELPNHLDYSENTVEYRVSNIKFVLDEGNAARCRLTLYVLLMDQVGLERLGPYNEYAVSYSVLDDNSVRINNISLYREF